MPTAWLVFSVVTMPPLPKVGSKLPAWAINKVEEQRSAPASSATQPLTTGFDLPTRTVIFRDGPKGHSKQQLYS